MLIHILSSLVEAWFRIRDLIRPNRLVRGFRLSDGWVVKLDGDCHQQSLPDGPLQSLEVKRYECERGIRASILVLAA